MSTSAATTFAPSRPKARAVARPTPEPAPVTTTTLSWKRTSLLLPPRAAGGSTALFVRDLSTLRQMVYSMLGDRRHQRIAAFFPLSTGPDRSGQGRRHARREVRCDPLAFAPGASGEGGGVG